MLVLCWPKLGLCSPMLTLCWPKLPLSCPYVDPMFTYVGLGNALPHSSDRNGGGGNGVTTGSPQGHPKLGRRLGGHASITFGYQPKASGKDTGTWPAPGLKGYRPGYVGPGWVDRRVGLCLVVRRLHVGSIYVVTQVCQPYIGPSSPARWPMVALCIGPISPLCWPRLALW